MKKSRVKTPEQFNKLMDELFEADKDNPAVGQTIEPELPSKSEKK